MTVRIRSSANPTWYQTWPGPIDAPALRARMRRLAFAGWARRHGLQAVTVAAHDDETGERYTIRIGLDTELDEWREPPADVRDS